MWALSCRFSVSRLIRWCHLKTVAPLRSRLSLGYAHLNLRIQALTEYVTAVHQGNALLVSDPKALYHIFAKVTTVNFRIFDSASIDSFLGFLGPTYLWGDQTIYCVRDLWDTTRRVDWQTCHTGATSWYSDLVFWVPMASAVFLSSSTCSIFY